MKKVSDNVVESGQELYCEQCRKHTIVEKLNLFGYMRNHCTRCRKLLSSKKGNEYDEEEAKIRRLITEG